MRKLSTSLFCSAVALFVADLNAAEITLVPAYTCLIAEGKPRIVLEFRVDGKRAVELLDVRKGAPYDATSYELKTGEGDVVALQPSAEDPPPGGLADSVLFVLTAPLEAKEHTFTVKDRRLHFVVKNQEIVLPETKAQITAKTITDVNKACEAEKQGGTVNSIELAGGTAGGTARFLYAKRIDRFLGHRWLNAELSVNGEMTLNSDDRDEYFNHLEGGLNLYNAFPMLDGYSELGVHAKAESDQVFDQVDGLVGVQFAHRLGHFFKIDRALPLFIVGYDYAHNLERDESIPPSALGIDTGRADHRFYAIARIRIPLARNFDFNFIPILGGKYDLDIDAEGKALYDINAEEFIDKSSLSLVFRSTSKDRFRPAFAFTWARGKESPTFQQINAFLAGMRLEF
jgi:hypothetical protein